MLTNIAGCRAEQVKSGTSVERVFEDVTDEVTRPHGARWLVHTCRANSSCASGRRRHVDLNDGSYVHMLQRSCINTFLRRAR